MSASVAGPSSRRPGVDAGSSSLASSRVPMLKPDTQRHDSGKDSGAEPCKSTSEQTTCESSVSESMQQRKRRRAGLQRLKKLNLALTLENSGSVARDHLASERTFLAYVRTSLAITSTGVALVQLFTIAADDNKELTKYSRPLGTTIIIIGLCALFLGTVRYFTVQESLIRGTFPVARVSMLLIAVAISTVVTVVFGILIGNRA